MQRFVNPKSGALRETLDRKTLNGVGTREFGPWKACYHTTRALVRSLQAVSPGISALGGAASVMTVGGGLMLEATSSLWASTGRCMMSVHFVLPFMVMAVGGHHSSLNMNIRKSR